MTAARAPARTRRGMNGRGIPVSTDCSADEIGELLELWRDIAGKKKYRRARATLGRLLTTTSEDV